MGEVWLPLRGNFLSPTLRSALVSTRRRPRPIRCSHCVAAVASARACRCVAIAGSVCDLPMLGRDVLLHVTLRPVAWGRLMEPTVLARRHAWPTRCLADRVRDTRASTAAHVAKLFGGCAIPTICKHPTGPSGGFAGGQSLVAPYLMTAQLKVLWMASTAREWRRALRQRMAHDRQRRVPALMHLAKNLRAIGALSLPGALVDARRAARRDQHQGQGDKRMAYGYRDTDYAVPEK